MLRVLDLRGFEGDVSKRLPRPQPPKQASVEAVREIIVDVRARGDVAVRELTKHFDSCDVGALRVSADEIEEALAQSRPSLVAALEAAAKRITTYHEAQLPASIRVGNGGIDIICKHLAVKRAGCYVPGGRAAYPSTVLMTAIVARVAGVSEIAICVPPGSGGKVNPATLAAAAVAEVDEVYAVGGAQAIAALAYGTETIRAVDVIVGPGNNFVALAKREVAGVVGVPSAFAGPSEVVVVADGSSPSELAAIDLVCQAEHGPDGLAWLITFEENVANEVCAAVAKLLRQSERKSDIESTLVSNGFVVLCDGPPQAIEIANHIAPEHLELQVADPDEIADNISNAGAIFCGPWSPASLGDYIAGPSHVLPTNGTAKFAGALGVRDFMKDVHVVSASSAGLASLAPHVEALADAEGLATHADSVRLRRKFLD